MSDMNGIAFYTGADFSVMSDPDDFQPGFDTTGLEYMNMYGLGDLTINLAVGGQPAVKFGTPTVVESCWARFTQNTSYLVTPVSDSNVKSIVAVYRNNRVNSNRPIVSNYNGTAKPGKMLATMGNTEERVFCGYTRGSDSSVQTLVAGFANTIQTPKMLVGKFISSGITISDITRNLSTTTAFGSGNTLLSTANAFRVGGSPTAWASAGSTVDIAAVLIFNREITDQDVAGIRTYLNNYLGTFGVTV